MNYCFRLGIIGLSLAALITISTIGLLHAAEPTGIGGPPTCNGVAYDPLIQGCCGDAIILLAHESCDCTSP